MGEDALLQLAASAEKGSEHPLGDAIVQSAESGSSRSCPWSVSRPCPGRGIEARIDGRTVLLGNEKLMGERAVDLGTPAGDLRLDGGGREDADVRRRGPAGGRA